MLDHGCVTIYSIYMPQNSTTEVEFYKLEKETSSEYLGKKKDWQKKFDETFALAERTMKLLGLIIIV